MGELRSGATLSISELKNAPETAVIIPVLNEEESIGSVLGDLPGWVGRVIVVDNGSTDHSSSIAEQHGAEVVFEPKRGYGAACLAGMRALPSPGERGAPEVVVFMDGDGADDPGQMGALVWPIVEQGRDFVIGSRIKGECDRGALSTTQRFGSWLSCRLIKTLYKVTYTDLGPFRAVRWSALHGLKMDDTGFGWTVQMQVRAARHKLSITEVPVDYRCRAAGKSKVSGTLRGIVGAGTVIL
jgi:glycosyltransferase involved in cell wall biosynthesis